MRTKDYILKRVKERGSISSSEIAKAQGITRQGAAQHLRELVAAKKILKLGTTIDSKYVPYHKSLEKQLATEGVKTNWHTKGLQEDKVFKKVDSKMDLTRLLSKPAHEIVTYAFTEMLNNAIDHSHSPRVGIEVNILPKRCVFRIKDQGIGVFESIRKKFKLKDHFEAVEHLLKGKQTTDPKRHSGQGIFFTSKIADRFVLRGAQLQLIIDNGRDDVFLEELKKSLKGTEVVFELAPKTKKSLKALFDEYSNEDYEFDRTKVLVHLSKAAGPYVSRSEAKRLVFGLDKYKRVTFDFKGVIAIGQAFADEIFRVFQNKYPQIQLEILHANKAVEFMIRRAKK